MAQYRGTLQGNRGSASRLGTKSSDLTVTAHGWHLGLRAVMYWDETAQEDRLRVELNSGSGYDNARRFLGIFRRKGRQIVKVS